MRVRFDVMNLRCWTLLLRPPLLPPPLVSELLLLPPLRVNREVYSDILCERQ
jgi:hypothetical protein